jgi:hypothetical protein
LVQFETRVTRFERELDLLSPLALKELNPKPYTLNPKPSTLKPKPSTLNPQPSTLNPQP